MASQMIEFEGNGQPYHGYLAPSITGKGPGVIVIQEWWGLVGHIRHVADRFAHAGFTALAPDLYLGETASEPDAAGKLMMALNIEQTEKILAGAVKRLLADPATVGGQVGVVGFCMGGQLSLFAAATNPEIGPCVDFYGIHPNVQPPFGRMRGPVLGFFAEHDAYADAGAVAALGQNLTKHGVKHEMITFAGTHHAFFNDERPEVYNESAANAAWTRMIEFFKANLAS